jgi:hypothetical protein
MAFTIAGLELFTEENPSPADIACFLSSYIATPITDISLALSVAADGTWDYSWDVNYSCWDTRQSLKLKLMRGHGSVCDYVLTSAGTIVAGGECTCTTEKESRNTALGQRLTKYLVFRARYPSARFVYIYPSSMEARTESNARVLRLYRTLGAVVLDRSSNGRAYGSGGPAAYPSMEELEADFCGKTGPRHNVPIRVTFDREHAALRVQGKLAKGAGHGISHDPNVGILSGIIAAAVQLTGNADLAVSVEQHGVTDLAARSSKWWVVNVANHVTLDGLVDSDTFGRCPASGPYFTPIDCATEKGATILLHHHLLEHGYTVIFTNHAGCERSKLLCSNGDYCSIPKKTPVPDILAVRSDGSGYHLLVVEGKVAALADAAAAQVLAAQPEMQSVVAQAGWNIADTHSVLCLAADKRVSEPKESYGGVAVMAALGRDGAFRFRSDLELSS